MNKFKFVTIVVMSLIVGIGVFYACKKDTLIPNEKSKGLLMCNYPQPTQIINIETFINVDNSIYSVEGSAVVGSYDGRIYECNLTWTNFAFSATLKSELYGIMIEADSIWKNYIVAIEELSTNNNVYVTSQSIEELWGRVVEFCSQNRMIPIAQLTNNNEIEHLFLQEDVQAFFSTENPDAELVFVEVKKDGDELGLLYRVYYSEDNAVETSFSLVLNLVGNTYYLALSGDNGTTTSLSCKTTAPDCVASTHGCTPWGTTSCNACPKKEDICEKNITVTTSTSALMTALPILSTISNALQYAVDVYPVSAY